MKQTEINKTAFNKAVSILETLVINSSFREFDKESIDLLDKINAELNNSVKYLKPKIECGGTPEWLEEQLFKVKTPIVQKPKQKGREEQILERLQELYREFTDCKYKVLTFGNLPSSLNDDDFLNFVEEKMNVLLDGDYSATRDLVKEIKIQNYSL
jgi:hypothetical protein